MTAKQGVLERHCDTSVIQTYIYPVCLLTTPIEQLSAPCFTWALIYPIRKQIFINKNRACCLQLSCATVFCVETAIGMLFFLWEIFKSAVTPVFLQRVFLSVPISSELYTPVEETEYNWCIKYRRRRKTTNTQITKFILNL